MKTATINKPKFLELLLIGVFLMFPIGLAVAFCPKEIAAANRERLLPDMFTYMSMALAICILGRWYRSSNPLEFCKWNIGYAMFPLVFISAVGLQWPQLFLPATIIYIPVTLLILGRWSAVKKYWPAMIFTSIIFGIHPVISQPIIDALLELSTKFAAWFSQIFLSHDYHRMGQCIMFCPDWMPTGVKSSSVMLIDECSGWRSLVGSLILAAMFCSVSYLNIKKTLIICSLAGLLAVAGNFLRIGVSISAVHLGWKNVSSHLGHSFLGNVIMFANVLIINQMVKKISINASRRPSSVNGNSSAI